jgi:hypothetical protein
LVHPLYRYTSNPYHHPILPSLNSSDDRIIWVFL